MKIGNWKTETKNSKDNGEKKFKFIKRQENKNTRETKGLRLETQTDETLEN